MNVLGFKLSVERNHDASSKWTRRALVLLAANGALLGSASAYAFWSASGSGTGTATTATAGGLTVTVTTVGNVYPTETTTVPVRVANTNPYSVALSSIVLNSVTTTSSGCNATDITLDPNAANVGVDKKTYTVSATITKAGSGASSQADFNVPIAVANLADSCQGADHSFTLSFTANGASS